MKLLLYRKSLLKKLKTKQTKQANTTGLTRPLGVQAHVLTEGDGESVSELMAG